MNLTNKHKDFENESRQLFVGDTILSVTYGEVKYFSDEFDNLNELKPFYKTKYSDIDSLDHSIYFRTNKKNICVFWDDTFFQYGLKSTEIECIEKINEFEQKWNVSENENWINVIGQNITDFEIIWEKIETINSENSNFTIYPQTFLIQLENGETIILSASEFKNSDENEIYPISDNIVVTTNLELAKRLKIINREINIKNKV